MTDSIDIHGTCDPQFQHVRDAFEDNFRTGRELGASFALYVNGEKKVDLWGGIARKKDNAPWEEDTIANVYSTTKGMTALCAHRLVDQGKLDLDAPVAEYWPEFAQEGKEHIPVRWLLSHQAGLAAVEKPLPNDALYDWNAMVDALAAQKPWWEPGTANGYHAVTFGFLVGEVVRRITGKSLGTYFREEVAEPLGLDFHIGLDEQHDARCADMAQAPMGSAMTQGAGRICRRRSRK